MSKHLLKFKGARSKSRTQQHFKDEVNVNTIMKKARRTGVLPYRGPEDCIFQDLTGTTDYLEAMNRVKAIDRQFQELPANIRNKFGNNPDAILKYLQEPKNEKEARTLGLLRPLTAEESEARRASVEAENKANYEAKKAADAAKETAPVTE